MDAPLDGIPLGGHVAHLLCRFEWWGRAAIVRQEGAFATEARSSGFAIIVNPDAALGLAQSLRLATLAARASGAEAMLVALADMPFVTAAHVEKLVAAFDPAADRTLVATGHGEGKAGPPAIFGAAHFERLLTLEGDAGARSLFRGAGALSVIPPSSDREVMDVDTHDDLVRAHRP